MTSTSQPPDQPKEPTRDQSKRPADDDRNFDDLAGRFRKTIYETPKGRLRLAALKADFDEYRIPVTGQDVLDIGGGQGQFALTLAHQGANITLCDLSSDMLVLAKQDFQAAGQQVRTIQSPLQRLDDKVTGQFTVVLNHAVLEWLAEPMRDLSRITRFVAPDGWLSLMFYNLHGHQWRQLMNGRTHAPRSANPQLREHGNAPQHPLEPQAVLQALETEGFDVLGWRGIRCIHDHMHQKIRERIGEEAIMKADLEFGTQEPYRQLGRYIHVVARKRQEHT